MRHVQRKVRQLCQGLRTQKAQPRWQCLGQVPGPMAGDDKAPLAKAGHMHVVGRGAQAHRFDGVGHRPEALARHQRRGGLHHGVAAGRQALVQQGIEAVGVELANGKVGRVGEVHHDHVKSVRVLLQPAEGVGIDDAHTRVAQRAGVELCELRVLAEQRGHGGVQLHQRDRLHRGVFEDFAHRHAVAAPQHGHFVRCAVCGHGGVHQGLVVAVFVALCKLQVAVEEQAVPRAPLGDHNALVRRGGGKHHPVLVELVFRQRRDMACHGHACAQCQRHQHAHHGMLVPAVQFMAEQPQRPQGDAHIHQPEQQPCADQAQLRHQQQRKGQRDRQRAQVVEGEHLRYQILERHVALEDAHDQRNFQPHQRAHRQHHAVEQQPESVGRVGIGQIQRGRHGAAHQCHQQFDAQEMRGQLPLQIARQPRSHAHGKEVGADDGGELQHRVPQHVRGQCARRQLVQQPAGGHHEHAGEQGDVDGAGPARRIVGGRGAKYAHTNTWSSCCARPSKLSQPNTARALLVRAQSSPTWRFSSS